MGSYLDQRSAVLHHGSHVQTSGRILGRWEAGLGSEKKEFAAAAGPGGESTCSLGR